MFRRLLAVALAVALLAAAGFALAQSDQLPTSKPAVPGGGLPVVPIVNGPPAAPTTPGRYAIVQAGKSAFLLDTATGKTWELERATSGAAWLPVQRLEDSQDVLRWRVKVRVEGAASGEQAERQAREVEALRWAADEASRAAAAQREQAERALKEAEQRLLELQRQKAKDQQK